MITISTDRFSYFKDEKRFIAEASDLPEWKGDSVLALKSQRTGKIIRVQLVREVRDQEQELVAWIYRSPMDLFSVEILND